VTGTGASGRLDLKHLSGVDRAPAAVSEGEELRLMALGLAFLYAAGALLVLVTLLLPRAPGARVGWLAAVALVACLVALGLLRGGERLPRGAYHVAAALGTGLIGVCVALQGRDASLYGLMYVWAGLYAFYFFTTLAAIAHVAWAAASFAAILATRDVATVPEAWWLMTTGTMVIAGILVGRLSGQVRRQSAALAERRITKERERRALEINDNIVQSLTVAKYSLQGGDADQASGALDDALRCAREIISEQLPAVGDGQGVRPGDLVRARRDRPGALRPPLG
jgi:signal transduction histidine kinase